jgi:hypothetical protein
MVNRPGPFSPESVGLDAPLQQTPFCGASIIDFNASIGWGGSPSTLQVNLIEDDQFVRPFDARIEGYAPMQGGNEDAPEAIQSANYIAEGPSTAGDGSNPDPDGYGIRMVDVERRLESKPTRAGKGLYTQGDFFWGPGLGTPCYFTFGDHQQPDGTIGWKFNGLCVNYQREMSSGGERFSVQLESPNKILEGTQVVLGNYFGTTIPQTPYENGIACGIGSYNIINAFGYYEHWDNGGGFGDSGRNEAGMVWHDPTRNGGILVALDDIINNWALRPPSSVFGGPLVYQQHVVKSKGSPHPNGVSYKYEIDLSQLRVDTGIGIPRHYRIGSNSMSLMSLISEVCEASSCDFFVSMEQPSSSQYSNGVYGVIKINVIKRHKNPQSFVVKETILNAEKQSSSNNNVVSNRLGASLVNNPTAKMVLGGQTTRMVGVHSTFYNQCGSPGIYTYQNHPSLLGFEQFPPSDMDEARIGAPGNQQIYPVFGIWERVVPVINGPDGSVYGGYSTAEGIGSPVLAGTQIVSGASADLSANINALGALRDFSVTETQIIDGEPITSYRHIFDIPIDCAKEGYPSQMLGYPYGPSDVNNPDHPLSGPQVFFTDGVHLASITELRIAATGDQAAWEDYIANYNIPVSKNLGGGVSGDMGVFADFIFGTNSGGFDAASSFDTHNTSYFAQKSADRLYDGDIEMLIAKVFDKIKWIASKYMGQLFMTGLPFTPPTLSEHIKVECVDEPAAWTGACTPSMQFSEAWEVADAAWVEMGTLGVPTDPKFYDDSGKLKCFVSYEMSSGGSGGTPHDFTAISPEKYQAIPVLNTVFISAQPEKKPSKVNSTLPDSPTITWMNGYPFVVVRCDPVKYVDPMINANNKIRRGPQGDRDGSATIAAWIFGEGQVDGAINRDQRWNTGWGSSLARATIDGALMKPSIIGVPQRSNRLLYGPWAEGYRFGATELEFDDNLTPENFGGIANMNTMGQSLAWHTAAFGMGHEESGDIKYIGIPTAKLGELLVSGGPYVTDVNVTINESDISTAYTMKTWTVNFGKLLKYNEDRVQSIVRGVNKVKSDLAARVQHAPILDPSKLGWTGGMFPSIRPNRFGGPNAGTPHHWIVGESFQDIERKNGQTSQISEFFSNVAIMSSKEVMAQAYRKNSLKAGVTLDGLFRPFCTSYDHMTQQEMNTNTGDQDKNKYHSKHYDIPGFEDGSLGPTPNVADLNPFTDDGLGHGHDIQGIIGGHAEYGTHQKDLNRRKGKRIIHGKHHSQERLVDEEYSEEYRSMGLRGPLVVVGWGYDVDGLPVPSDPNDNTKFLNNHKKRQDLWKAGPVDLRWDDDKKVWVAGGGGGGSGDIWLSTCVNATGALAQAGTVAGVNGAAYSGLAAGSISSYCLGGCTHDAIAMFRASESPHTTTAGGTSVRKNRAVEIRLEETTGFDIEGQPLFTSGGWLGQPIPAGTEVFTIDTGRVFTDPVTQKQFPIHWVLQAQFTQVSLISAITCSFDSNGESTLIVCTTDLWTEGPVTTQSCPSTGIQCP